MGRCTVSIILALLAVSSVSPIASGQISQPDIVQEHWYHSYATLTLDVNAWADEHPDIVKLLVVGSTELGRNLWMLQISDWSNEARPDGSPKDVVYIDGGHHGNEHLGTELAFLTAELYIEGWEAGDQDVMELLSTTELHILIMLNADGNDFDTRWNVNQVDLFLMRICISQCIPAFGLCSILGASGPSSPLTGRCTTISRTRSMPISQISLFEMPTRVCIPIVELAEIMDTELWGIPRLHSKRMTSSSY